MGEGTPEQGSERATTSPLPEGEGQGEGCKLLLPPAAKRRALTDGLDRDRKPGRIVRLD